MDTSLLVVSDFHIGCGALDDFDAELEQHFAAFLAREAAHDSPVELVINGDLLDFVQAPPYQGSELETSAQNQIALCFTESQSLTKLSAILEAHQNTMAGLRNFLDRNPDHRIVILPGNHDADFFWKSVRDRFIADLAAGDPSRRARIRFHLDRVYRPEACPEIWIEHGHQFDLLNRFFLSDTEYWSEKVPPIWNPGAGSPRLIECIGTRFLIRYLNAIDSRYPFVDNVKPFSRFLKIFCASALSGSGSIKVAVAVAALLRYMAVSVYTGQANDLLAWQGKDDAGPQPLLIDAVGKLPEHQRKALSDAIMAAGYPGDAARLTMALRDEDEGPRLIAFLGEHLDLLSVFESQDTADDDVLSLDGDDETLGLLKGFRANETKDLQNAADAVLKAHPDVQAVIMGHTHEPVNTPESRYFNTGSWTRYYRFRKDEATRPWKVLKDNSYEDFPYELNYVEINCHSKLSVAMKNYCRRPEIK